VYQDYLSNVVGVIYMRTDQAPFNDVRVRPAISHAIDRQGLIEAVWGRSKPTPAVARGLVEWSLPVDRRHRPRQIHWFKGEMGHCEGFSQSVEGGGDRAQHLAELRLEVLVISIALAATRRQLRRLDGLPNQREVGDDGGQALIASLRPVHTRLASGERRDGGAGQSPRRRIHHRPDAGLQHDHRTDRCPVCLRQLEKFADV
jgi:hypothetical protein